eukprot:g5898.t1
MKLSKARLSNEPESVSGKIAAEYSILRDALNNLETQLREAAEETSRAKDAWVSIYSFKTGSSNPPSESDLARICEKYKGKCKISLGRKGKRSSFEFPKSEAADHSEESKMKPSNLGKAWQLDTVSEPTEDMKNEKYNLYIEGLQNNLCIDISATKHKIYNVDEIVRKLARRLPVSERTSLSASESKRIKARLGFNEEQKSTTHCKPEGKKWTPRCPYPSRISKVRRLSTNYRRK